MRIEEFNELPTVEQLKVTRNWLKWLHDTQWNEEVPGRMLDICRDLIDQRMLVELDRIKPARWIPFGDFTNGKGFYCSNCGHRMYMLDGAYPSDKKCTNCRREMV